MATFLSRLLAGLAISPRCAGRLRNCSSAAAAVRRAADGAPAEGGSRSPVKVHRAYVLYAKDVLPELGKENPDAHYNQLIQMVEHSWQSMDNRQKQPYIGRHRKLRAAYQADLDLIEKEAMEQHEVESDDFTSAVRAGRPLHPDPYMAYRGQSRQPYRGRTSRPAAHGHGGGRGGHSYGYGGNRGGDNRGYVQRSRSQSHGSDYAYGGNRGGGGHGYAQRSRSQGSGYGYGRGGGGSFKGKQRFARDDYGDFGDDFGFGGNKSLVEDRYDDSFSDFSAGDLKQFLKDF